MKKKKLIWTIAAVCLGLIVVFGLGSTAITNAKDFFNKNEESEPVVEETVDDTTTQASIDYDYEIA